MGVERPWFTFDVRSSVPPSPELSLVEALASVFEDRPYWMVDATEKVSLFTLKSARSKARDAPVSRPSRERVRAALARPRESTVFGGHAYYSDGADAVGIVGASWRSFYRADFRCLLPEGDLRDGRCGEVLFRIARTLVEGCGDVSWGAGWIGERGLSLAAGVGYKPGPGMTYGYSYMMVLTPDVLEVIGGVEAVRRCPAAAIHEVTTMSGQRCVLVLLSNSPDELSDVVLREWRTLLLPAMLPDAVVRRREALERVALQPIRSFELPPMVLPEDRPS